MRSVPQKRADPARRSFAFRRVIALLKNGPLSQLDRKWLRGDEGASVVEFALVATVLLSIILGVMEICLALFTFHSISEVAREGSRYAMVRGDMCVVSGVSCTTSEAAIQSYMRGLGYPGINPSNMTVTATYSAYPAGSGCAPNANCENPGNLVTINVVYQFPLTIPFMPASTLAMTSTSAMVISQ